MGILDKKPKKEEETQGASTSKKQDANDPVPHFKFRLVDDGHGKAKVLVKEDFNDGNKLKPVHDDEGRKTVYLDKLLKEIVLSKPNADILNEQATNTRVLYLESKDQKQTPAFNVVSQID